jgi:hypothetical protein
MVPARTRRQNGKRYGYYVCGAAQKRGWNTCPSKSVPAAALEAVVVEQIGSLGCDPGTLRALLTHGLSSDQAPASAEPAERNGRDTATNRAWLPDNEVAAALAAYIREGVGYSGMQRGVCEYGIVPVERTSSAAAGARSGLELRKTVMAPAVGCNALFRPATLPTI